MSTYLHLYIRYLYEVQHQCRLWPFWSSVVWSRLSIAMSELSCHQEYDGGPTSMNIAIGLVLEAKHPLKEILANCSDLDELPLDCRIH